MPPALLSCSLQPCLLHAGLGTPRLLHGSRACQTPAHGPASSRACGTPRPVAPPPPRRPEMPRPVAPPPPRAWGCPRPGSHRPWPAVCPQSCRSSHCTGSSRPSPAWCTSACCSRLWDLFFYEGSLVLFQALGMLRLKVTAQPRRQRRLLAAPAGPALRRSGHRLLRPEHQPIEGRGLSGPGPPLSFQLDHAEVTPVAWVCQSVAPTHRPAQENLRHDQSEGTASHLQHAVRHPAAGGRGPAAGGGHAAGGLTHRRGRGGQAQHLAYADQGQLLGTTATLASLRWAWEGGGPAHLRSSAPGPSLPGSLLWRDHQFALGTSLPRAALLGVG